MDGKSLDILHDNTEKLKQLFPEIFSEGKIDMEKFKELRAKEVIIRSNSRSFS